MFTSLLKRCDELSFCDISNDIIKAKLFPHSLQGEAKYWVKTCGLLLGLLLLENLENLRSLMG
jgi:hypothetical protein